MWRTDERLHRPGLRSVASELFWPIRRWLFCQPHRQDGPEHKRLYRYRTMTNAEIMAMPVDAVALPQSHLYLWVPNALVGTGLEVMKAWGLSTITNIIWYKIRKDGGPDRRGVASTSGMSREMVLFRRARLVVRNAPTGQASRRISSSRKNSRAHSRKPDELYSIIEACSPGPFLEFFRPDGRRKGMDCPEGDQANGDYDPASYTSADGETVFQPLLIKPEL